jgi:hypothetical protein
LNFIVAIVAYNKWLKIRRCLFGFRCKRPKRREWRWRRRRRRRRRRRHSKMRMFSL